MITVEQGRPIIEARIENKTRHEHYDRTVNRRKLYHAMMTGEGLSNYLNHFELRESAEEFKARTKITQQCVTPPINEAAARFGKTSRYPNIKKELKYEKGSDRSEILNSALGKFCHDGDVQSFLALDFDNKSLIDPNSFLVLDFESFDALQNKRPEVYGVFIPCDEVVDFEYLPNDELNYLIIEKTVEIFNEKNEKIKLKDYIGYLGDSVLVYHEVHEDRKLADGELIDIGNEQYRFHDLNSEAKQVQAIRLGYLKDPITNYKTVISPLDKAETVVMDLNNDKSEYDQTKRCHVFPQKLQFEQKCPGESDVKTCSHGKTVDGNTCGVCKGKGVLLHASSADVLTLPMPKDKDDYFLPLADMIHYAKPDIEIIKHLREDVESSKLSIMKAIFTSESAVKTDGTVKIDKTATEFVMKADDVSDIILPYALHKSKIYKFIIRQVAIFNDIEEGLKILFEYPASLRLETVEELQAKFAVLVAAGASPSLLDDIEKEIATKRFIDDQEGLLRYEVRGLHRPFRNRAPSEVQFMVGAGLCPKWREVLYANYESIMTELEHENSNFYQMKFEQRNELIKSRAKEYAAELEPEAAPGGFLKTSTQEAA